MTRQTVSDTASDAVGRETNAMTIFYVLGGLFALAILALGLGRFMADQGN